MSSLHLGFVDVPYPGQKPSRNGKGRYTRATERSIQVAEELETRYHIVETFSDDMLSFFAEELEYYYQEQLDELFESRTRSGPGKFSRNVTMAFRNFIKGGGMDNTIRGVPTKASKLGKTFHPGYNQTALGQRRPSFYDTGTYIGAFRAWID